ncbi:DUF6571 family protein [Nonomuraea angiospora]|uniref:DUF6571 family protein n=1 Tax=Nonomuraea angiospora TaxID=46172 RepID=UPI00379C0985
MTKVIAMLKRAGPEFRESSRQVESALGRLGVEFWTSPALRRVADQMSAKPPDLQGRLDLILATPDAALERDGIIWADGADWQSSTTEGAAAAQAVAAKVRAQSKSGTFDAQTIADLEKHKNDPLFAAAFAKEIPPDELKRLISRLFRTDLPPAGRPDEKDLDTEKKVADLFSTILGTASRAGKLPDKYADELLKDLDDPQSAFAIGKLLGKGKFDHAFMLDAVKRVYDFDVAHPQARAREPELPLPGQDQVRPAPDVSPMSTVLSALIHHPKVGQDFFTDPKRRPLAYLMRERRWGPERQPARRGPLRGVNEVPGPRHASGGSFLIIGQLQQLLGQAGGDHQEKIRSFELYRRNTAEPEILTFDELLARAEWFLATPAS